MLFLRQTVGGTMVGHVAFAAARWGQLRDVSGGGCPPYGNVFIKGLFFPLTTDPGLQNSGEKERLGRGWNQE